VAVNLQVHTPAVPKKGTLGAVMGWPYSYQVMPAGAGVEMPVCLGPNSGGADE
jgi:hypothetical protein